MPNNENIATPEVDLDPEARSLLLEQKKAEARKAIAEAHKAEINAYLPDLKVDPPAETLDAGEKASPVSELLAYAELDAATGEIVTRIKRDVVLDSLDGRTVVLVPTANLTVDHGVYVTLRSFKDVLSAALDAAIARLQEPSREHRNEEFVPPAAVALVLSALPTVLSLARSNTIIRARDFTITRSAVTAALSQQLRIAKANVVVADFARVPENGIVAEISSLQRLRDALVERQSWWQIEHVDAPTPRLAKQNERLTTLYKKRDEMVAANPPQQTDDVDKAIESLRGEIAATEGKVASARFNIDLAQRIVTAADAFLAAIHAMPTGGAAPPIVTAALYERFITERDAGFVLFAEASFGGGESQTEEKIGRDKALYLGGVALSYLLTDATGFIKSSGIVCRLAETTQTIGKRSFDRESESFTSPISVP